MTRAQAGDEAAFATLAGMVGDRLLGLAFRILRDRDRAEEATQRTLVAAWEGNCRGCATQVDSSRGSARCSPTPATASCAATAAASSGGSARIPAQHAPDPSVDIVERDAIDRAFRRLPPDLRIILAYRYFVDLPVERIAEELRGILEGTVKSRLHRATGEIPGGPRGRRPGAVRCGAPAATTDDELPAIPGGRAWFQDGPGPLSSAALEAVRVAIHRRPQHSPRSAPWPLQGARRAMPPTVDRRPRVLAALAVAAVIVVAIVGLRFLPDQRVAVPPSTSPNASASPSASATPVDGSVLEGRWSTLDPAPGLLPGRWELNPWRVGGAAGEPCRRR